MMRSSVISRCESLTDSLTLTGRNKQESSKYPVVLVAIVSQDGANVASLLEHVIINFKNCNLENP